jgi:hypothetical protein
MAITFVYQMAEHFFLNGHKIYVTFSVPRPSKIYPKWDFGYENIPADNPALKNGYTRPFALQHLGGEACM